MIQSALKAAVNIFDHRWAMERSSSGGSGGSEHHTHHIRHEAVGPSPYCCTIATLRGDASPADKYNRSFFSSMEKRQPSISVNARTPCRSSYTILYDDYDYDLRSFDACKTIPSKKLKTSIILSHELIPSCVHFCLHTFYAVLCYAAVSTSCVCFPSCISAVMVFAVMHSTGGVMTGLH